MMNYNWIIIAEFIETLFWNYSKFSHWALSLIPCTSWPIIINTNINMENNQTLNVDDSIRFHATIVAGVRTSWWNIADARLNISEAQQWVAERKVRRKACVCERDTMCTNQKQLAPTERGRIKVQLNACSTRKYDIAVLSNEIQWNPYVERDDISVLYLLSIGLFPFAVAVIQIEFRSKDKKKLYTFHLASMFV